MFSRKYITDFTLQEIEVGRLYLLQECDSCPFWISHLWEVAWRDFELGRFSYDGATFVKERNPETLFEVAAFIHDWYNCNGYVGKGVDELFILIMGHLSYNSKCISRRSFLLNLTFLNMWRHKYILKDYKGDINVEEVIKFYTL